MSPIAVEQPNVENDAIAKMTELIMCHGYTYAHAFQVTEEQMKAIYAWGYELQKRRQFEKATRVFEYLCYLNHYDAGSWTAMGFCREKRNLYQKALQAYVMAGTLEPKNPIPPLRAAECLLRLGHLAPAKKAAKRAIQLAGDEPQFQQRRDRAQSLLKAIARRQRRNRT